MKINNYQDALDEHTRLLASLSPTTKSDRQIRATMIISPLIDSLNEEQTKVLHDMVKNSTPGETFLNVTEKFIDSSLGPGYLKAEVDSFIASEIAYMRQAQTIFCSSEIIDEIMEAQETMLDSILIPQDIFVEDGLLVLEKPFIYKNLVQDDMNNSWHCEDIEVRMIMFTRTETRANEPGVGIHIYGYYSAVHFFDSDKKPEHPWADSDYSYVYNREKDETVCISRKTEDISKVEKYHKRAHNIFNFVGTKTPELYDITFFAFGETQTIYDEAILLLKKFMLAFFRLTHEYLEVESNKPDRPFQKRAKRAGRNIPEDGYITVMSLRRKLYDGDGSGETRNGPAYAFRVRGHWRKAYMASRKLPVGDPGAYKHIYIKDYIKGKGRVVRSKRIVKVGD